MSWLLLQHDQIPVNCMGTTNSLLIRSVNYLAHAYLSFHQPEILAGNMISDFVKGKKQYDFATGIQSGIRLHRAIDTFTDEHPLTKEAASIFKPWYRLYSGALMDVVYDHFLAIDNNRFPGSSLYDFSQEVYDTLDRFTGILPEKFRLVFPYMKKYNWLYHYRERSGIARSLEGLVHRATWLTESDTAFRLFEDHYDELQRSYAEFFPSLQRFAMATLTGTKH